MGVSEIIQELQRKHPNGISYKNMESLINANKELFNDLAFLQKNKAACASLEAEFRFCGLLSVEDEEIRSSKVVSEVCLEDQKRIEQAVIELRKRYPMPRSEGTYENLKKANPDLNLNVLGNIIRRVTGFSATEYFTREKFIVPVKLRELGVSGYATDRLKCVGIRYIGELMKLTDNEIEKIDLIDCEKANVLELKRRYHALCGAHITELNLSNRIMHILEGRDVRYAYQLLGNTERFTGIGVVAAGEIRNALAEYVEAYYTRENKALQTVADDEEIPLPAEETFEDGGDEAEDRLLDFVAELYKRYPPDRKKESLMVFLRRNNPDLPFEEADSWCRLVYEKALKDYLKEMRLLVPNGNEAEENEAEETQNTENNIAETQQIPSPKKPFVESNTEIRIICQEDIDDYVRRDTEGYQRFVEANGLDYTMDQVYAYLRRLYRQDMSAFLKKEQMFSYNEYLILHGLLPAKPLTYWKGILLSYLRKNYLVCEDGTLVCSQESFEYDIHRDICKIAAPIYSGYYRAAMFSVEDRNVGKLMLQPCYCEENYSCDVAVVFNDKTIGGLNRNLFRGTGLGMHLFALLCTGAAMIQSATLTQDEYPYAILELQFVC